MELIIAPKTTTALHHYQAALLDRRDKFRFPIYNMYEMEVDTIWRSNTAIAATMINGSKKVGFRLEPTKSLLRRGIKMYYHFMTIFHHDTIIVPLECNGRKTLKAGSLIGYIVASTLEEFSVKILDIA